MTECPECGCKFSARAPLGLGTIRARGMKVNSNRAAILAVIGGANMEVGVKDIQHELCRQGVKRESKRHAGWNYHTVQADVSVLLANGLVQMVKPLPVETFDKREGFSTDRIPKYKLVTRE